MNIPRGGRGHKAPYQTVVMRVPLELHPEFEFEVNRYREQTLKGEQPTFRKPSLSLSEAKEEAKKILKGRKSAKKSLAKLLQVLYEEEVLEDDLT